MKVGSDPQRQLILTVHTDPVGRANAQAITTRGCSQKKTSPLTVVWNWVTATDSCKMGRVVHAVTFSYRKTVFVNQ